MKVVLPSTRIGHRLVIRDIARDIAVDIHGPDYRQRRKRELVFHRICTDALNLQNMRSAAETAISREECRDRILARERGKEGWNKVFVCLGGAKGSGGISVECGEYAKDAKSALSDTRPPAESGSRIVDETEETLKKGTANNFIA